MAVVFARSPDGHSLTSTSPAIAGSTNDAAAVLLHNLNHVRLSRLPNDDLNVFFAGFDDDFALVEGQHYSPINQGTNRREHRVGDDRQHSD